MTHFKTVVIAHGEVGGAVCVAAACRCVFKGLVLFAGFAAGFLAGVSTQFIQ